MLLPYILTIILYPIPSHSLTRSRYTTIIMRNFIAAFFIAGAAAQSVEGYLSCAVRSRQSPYQPTINPNQRKQEAALDSIPVSQLEKCSNKSTRECLCSSSDALASVKQSASSACAKAGVGTTTPTKPWKLLEDNTANKHRHKTSLQLRLRQHRAQHDPAARRPSPPRQ